MAKPSFIEKPVGPQRGALLGVALLSSISVTPVSKSKAA